MSAKIDASQVAMNRSLSPSEEKRRLHRDMRLRACAEVQRVLASTFPEIRLTEIDGKARVAANEWISSRIAPKTVMVPAWDWKQLWRKFSRKACRVELAVWIGDGLYGLAIGRVSPRRVVATIHYLQRSPLLTKSQASLGRIATAYLVALAKELGCREVAVDRPLPELVTYYKELGFNREILKGKRVVRLVYRLTTAGLA